jgi:hypothetical protein
MQKTRAQNIWEGLCRWPLSGWQGSNANVFRANAVDLKRVKLEQEAAIRHRRDRIDPRKVGERLDPG